jgi:hypothetical protein
VQGTACKILDEEVVKPHKVRYYLERRDPDLVKPHKVRYYLERRDPDFAEKMAQVVCV